MLNIWYAVLYFFSSATVAVLSFSLIRKTTYKKNTYFILVVFASTAGLIFGGMNYLIPDESIRILFHELKHINSIFGFTFYFLYLYKFFYEPDAKYKLIVWLLLIISTTIFIIMITNPYHYLYKADLEIKYYLDSSIVSTTEGLLFYPITVYLYLLYLGGLGIIIRNLIRYRKIGIKSIFAVIMMFTPFALHFVYTKYGGLDTVDYVSPIVPMILIITIFLLDKTSFRVIVPIVKQSIISRIALPVFALNEDMRVLYSNEAANQRFNIEDMCSLDDFMNKKEQYSLFNKDTIILNGRCYNVDYSAVRNKKEEIVSHLFILSDITRIKNMMEDYEKLSYIDSLTGLYNRRYMFDKFDYSRMRKNIAITVLDIDGFKQINDALGHAKGDYYLKAMADILKKYIDDRNIGITVRIGGDEFLFILFDINEEYLISLTDEIKEEFGGLGQSASFGYVIEKKYKFKDLDLLIAKADDRMYKNKFKVEKNLQRMS